MYCVMHEWLSVVDMIMKIYYDFEGQHLMEYLAERILAFLGLDVLPTDMSRFLNISNEAL